MNFDLSEEQQMFVTSVERFAAPIDVEARRRLRLSPTGYDRARWQELAEMGLIALAAGEDARFKADFPARHSPPSLGPSAASATA